jgi:hypothetical protein
MAYYQDESHVKQWKDEMFDKIHGPGEHAIYSGVYRCEGCGKEISHNAGVSLPPQNHHQHSVTQGTIRWRLIVWAVTG